MTVFCFQSGWTSCPAARTFSVDLFPPNCIQLWILWTFDLWKFLGSELSGVRRYCIVPNLDLDVWVNFLFLFIDSYVSQTKSTWVCIISAQSLVIFKQLHTIYMYHSLERHRERVWQWLVLHECKNWFHQECTRPQQALRLSLPACLLVSSQTMLQNMCSDAFLHPQMPLKMDAHFSVYGVNRSTDSTLSLYECHRCSKLSTFREQRRSVAFLSTG